MATRARRAGESVAALGVIGSLLHTGARVADVRSGDGRALIALARSFPRSSFHGFEVDAASVRAARRAAAEAGVSERVTFELAPGAIPAQGYDLLVDGDRLTVAVTSAGDRSSTRGA